MNFYWVCTEGIIWTLNTTWGTNYTRHKVRLDKVEDPNYTYQITILAEDGEEIDSFVAWTSLQELGKAIEEGTRVMHRTIKEVLGTACYNPSAVARLKLNKGEQNG